MASKEKVYREIFKEFKTYFIKPLTIQETTEYIRDLLKETPIVFTSEALQSIWELTGGRVHEVDALCRELLQKRSRFTYRVEDIEASMDNMTFHWNDNYERNYERTYHIALSFEEQNMLKKIVERKEIPVTEIDANEIQPLVDVGLIVKNSDKGVYQIAGLKLLENLIQIIRAAERRGE